jgi:hypothetical protein
VGATPDQLKREIDQTREELKSDAEALAEHLNPKQVARRQAETLKEKMREPRAQAAVAGVVSLLLLRRVRRHRRAKRLTAA